jgi:hypothetical protein
MQSVDELEVSMRATTFALRATCLPEDWGSSLVGNTNLSKFESAAELGDFSRGVGLDLEA